MLVIGMATLFAGYAVGSYGWVLLKGWNIPFRAWVSPLNPYTWPAGGADPPPIPADKLFPSSAAPATASMTAAEARGGGAPRPAGPPRPQPRGKSVLP